uniref:Uncharacterized protein n=1 Tax=Rhizophora mucronata TaxID=61149 RepID=A0A2P2K1W2_RHIMU
MVILHTLHITETCHGITKTWHGTHKSVKFRCHSEKEELHVKRV